jgi:molybdopterin converting factor small subunit
MFSFSDFLDGSDFDIFFDLTEMLMHIKITIMSWDMERELVEISMPNEVTVRQVLNYLQTTLPEKAAAVFNPHTQSIHSWIIGIINGSVMDMRGGMEARLKDKDELTFIPAYMGG